MSRLAFLIALAAAAQAPAQEPTFRTGTRLVEVEVTVRAQRVRPPGVGEWLKWTLDSGPPFGPPGLPVKGLTKDDFTLLDQGKPQPIAVFRSGPAEKPGGSLSFAVPPGAVSNRASSDSQPPDNATVVLIDLLNTPFELTDYARLGLKEFLRTLPPGGHGLALYSLGDDLHLLRDFNDPSSREAAASLNDYGDLLALEGGGPVAAEVHARITAKAIQRIVQHLAGVPGRKNLVWVSGLIRLPPIVMAMLQRANIVLYPVGVRAGGFTSLEGEFSTREDNTASGGRPFLDARDLKFAVQTAEEDTQTTYVLGYYPPSRMLDGKFHKITVKVQAATPEIHYRSGYLATKTAPPAPQPSLSELLDDPLDSSLIGFTAQASPEPDHPGLYDLHLTVDLHDIHMERKGGRLKGAFVVVVPSPVLNTTLKNDSLKNGTIALDLTDEQFGSALRDGFPVVFQGAEAESGQIRVVVRDRATGISGSVRVPAPEAPPTSSRR